MDKKTHTESVMKEMLRIRKALDRLSLKIEKEPELMGSDYMNELANEISGSACEVTDMVHDRTSYNG